jgi:hypothetical protein
MKGGPDDRPLLLLDSEQKVWSLRSAVALMPRRLQADEDSCPQTLAFGDILKAVPHLRAFAISLTGDGERADDLVQDALVRALGNLDKFTPGTSMQAWLFTILRNQVHTAYCRRQHEIEGDVTLMGNTNPILVKEKSCGVRKQCLGLCKR